MPSQGRLGSGAEKGLPGVFEVTAAEERLAIPPFVPFFGGDLGAAAVQAELFERQLGR